MQGQPGAKTRQHRLFSPTKLPPLAGIHRPGQQRGLAGGLDGRKGERGQERAGRGGGEPVIRSPACRRTTRVVLHTYFTFFNAKECASTHDARRSTLKELNKQYPPRFVTLINARHRVSRLRASFTEPLLGPEPPSEPVASPSQPTGGARETPGMKIVRMKLSR